MSKKVTALSTAAVLAASAIVPVAASAAPTEAVKISHVVFTTENGLASLPMADYNAALAANVLNVKASHVQLANGETYKMADYNAALAASNGDTVKAIELLTENENPVTSKVTPGEVVDGKVAVEGAEVKPPTVLNGLQIDTNSEIIADGVSTQVVTFNVLTKDGKVDTTANNIVLDLNTTFGYLSQKRLTIQNGTGQVILRSEFLADERVAKIDAQVIETDNANKNLIGEKFTTKEVTFKPAGSGSSGETVKVKSLTAANTNEADRVVLLFDEDMTTNDFYTVVGGKPVLHNNIKVSQKGTPLSVKGFLFDENNKKKVTVVLERTTVLEDNNDVYVEYSHLNGTNIVKKSTQTFKLQDARVPNLTAVDVVDHRHLTATFSEPIYDASFVINGQFKSGEHFKVNYGDIEYKNGQWIDSRHIAKLELNEKYVEKVKDANGKLVDHTPGYFAPGIHALEASSIYDFAAITDKNNIGTTQVLEFNVEADDAVAAVIQKVQSPEQYTVEFSKAVKLTDKFENLVEFQVLKKATEQEKKEGKKDEWVKVNGEYFKDALEVADWDKFLAIEAIGQDKYKLETTTDWTKVYDTAKTKNNYYNDEFRLVLPKETVITAANGKKNQEEVVLPLTYIDGSSTALATPDVTSPTIDTIEKTEDFNAKTNPTFVVTMSEPVKLLGHKDNGGETLAQNQAALPETKVEFLVKDKDNKVRTFNGTVVGYEDKLNTQLIVKWDNATETPQTIVDDEKNTNDIVTVVVKSISDDVGNTAPTNHKDFKLDKTVVTPVDGEFRVVPTGGSAIGEDGVAETYQVKGITNKDEVHITYTEAVAVTGTGSATNVKNYTLNGKDLPAGSTIAAVPQGKDEVQQTVVISLPKGTLKDSNVITLAKNIQSKELKALKYDVVFTFKTDAAPDNDLATKEEKDALQAAIEEAKKPETTEGKTEDSIKALNDAIAQAEATLNKPTSTSDDVKAAQKAVEDAVKALKDEEVVGETVAITDFEPLIIRKNPINQKLIVAFDSQKLPTELQGKELVAVLEGKEYPVEKADGTNLKINFPSTTDEDTAKKAVIKVAQ